MEDSDDVWWAVTSRSVGFVGFMKLGIVNVSTKCYVYSLIIRLKGISRKLDMICQPFC